MTPVAVFPEFANVAAFVALLVGGGLPMGIPPAAEDPLVSQVAPAECLLYWSWAGMAKPDPASRNQTEQLLAEAEVQECLAELESRIVVTLRGQATSDPQAAAMIDPMIVAVRAVLTSPTAAFISRLDVGGRHRGPCGGALVHLGNQAAKVEQALAAIEKALMKSPAAKPADKSTPWRRLPAGPKDLVVEWAVQNDCLVVGVGQGEADKILARMREKPPAWLTQLRQRIPVPRLSNLVYLNMAGILKVAGPQIGGDARAVLDATGLAHVRSLVRATGLDDFGCTSKIHIASDGELKGLLSVFAGRPLAKEHLALIPKDATLAAAARLDLARAYQTVLEAVGRADPRMRDELMSGVAVWEKAQKLKLSQDVLESVGDVWRVYNSPTEGGLILTGLTAVVNLRDHDRLVAANAKLVFGSLAGGFAKQISGQGRRQETPPISQSKFGRHTVFSLSLGDVGSPFVLSWCITDTELVVAMSPQNVRAYLSREAGGPPTGSLADVPAAAGLFPAGKAPVAVAYADTAGLFKIVYPIVQMVLPSVLGELPEGVARPNGPLLPSALSIVRHLRPTVAAVRRDESGIVIETRQTLPMASGATLIQGLLMAWSIPVGIGAHEFPTPQNASMNHLKQILLAMHMHHAGANGFPAAAAPQKPGQPPVSWRVRLLPYLESQTLYDQYRLDEPWDSEHNKKLIPQMPAVFTSPGSQVVEQGKTNYLAVVGDDYALAAGKERPINEFRDGTSNTLLVVEVSDGKAVAWTKPEDYTVDKANPAAGLVGLRVGGFLAGFADGSVRRIPATIDAGSLNALFTRGGGEVVSVEDAMREAKDR